MRKIFILAAVVMALALLGCAGQDFVSTSYKTMATAKIAYVTIEKSAADAYGKGLLNDAQKAEIIKVGDDFYRGYMTAQVALEDYASLTQPNATLQQQITTALGDMSANLATLTALYNPAANATGGK